MKKHFKIAVAASFILFLISCSPSIEKHISILKDYKECYKLDIYEQLELLERVSKVDNTNSDYKNYRESYAALKTFVDEHESAIYYS